MKMNMNMNMSMNIPFCCTLNAKNTLSIKKYSTTKKLLVNTIVPELVVVTLLIEELLMTAMLHNLAIVNNVDLVHIFYGGQPVGNSDCSAPNLGSIQGILYNLKQKKLRSVF